MADRHGTYFVVLCSFRACICDLCVFYLGVHAHAQPPEANASFFALLLYFSNIFNRVSYLTGSIIAKFCEGRQLQVSYCFREGEPQSSPYGAFLLDIYLKFRIAFVKKAVKLVATKGKDQCSK